MSISYRIYVIDRNDQLLRMAIAKFERLLRDPSNALFPEFSGQRVRSASVTVECVSLKPVRVIQILYNILVFDEDGQLNAEMFSRHQASRGEVALARYIPAADCDPNILEAGAQFLDKGGRWTPSRALEQAIDDAVFGRKSCPRI